MSLHKEIAFEIDICEHLAAHGWLYAEGDNAKYDRARALFPEDVLAWVHQNDRLSPSRGSETDPEKRQSASGAEAARIPVAVYWQIGRELVEHHQRGAKRTSSSTLSPLGHGSG